MRGIEGPRRYTESFPKLLSVTKADPNNFCFLQFTVRGCRVGTAEERRKKERTQVKTMVSQVATHSAHNSLVPNPLNIKMTQHKKEMGCVVSSLARFFYNQN